MQNQEIIEKNKKNKIGIISKFLINLLLCSILLLSICILDKYNVLEIEKLKKEVSTNINILNVVNKINGKINIIDLGEKYEEVSNEYFETNIGDKDIKLETNQYSGIKCYISGVVVKIIKNNYYEIYIKALDDNTYVYGHIESIDVNIYKYVKSDEIIGLSKDYYTLRRESV